MSKSVTRRISKYRRKLDVEHIAKQYTLAKDEMVALNAQAQTELKAVEDMARAAMSEKGVATVDYPKYLNFVRQVWKIRKNFGGKTLDNEVDILLYKWWKRGCDKPTLEKIRDDVFSVEAPKP